MSQTLVARISRVVDSRAGRRGFLSRSALGATALAVAPVTYVLRPTTAHAAICGCNGTMCECENGCCDGYTDFCCKLSGLNLCPPGTIVAATGGLSLSAVSAERVLLHLANFALPPHRGDYGSGAVETMDGGSIFITLWEYNRQATGDALFRTEGFPRGLQGDDFSPDALQRRIPGQGGLQRFFQSGGRAFVLYVVIGSYRARNVLAVETNRILEGIRLA